MEKLYVEVVNINLNDVITVVSKPVIGGDCEVPADE